MLHPTIPLNDLTAGTMKKIIIGENGILLANVNGEVYATHHSCTHQYAELENGRIEGCIVECPLHGGMFDVRDGSVQALPPVTPLKTYKTKIENGVIHVDLGDNT